MLTKEVAAYLGLSDPTIRNYAKTLERYNHEFKKRKQARLWTDTEINMIREIQELYNENDYPLDTCFQYVIAKRNVGEEKAKELLERPVSDMQQEPSPQLDKIDMNVMELLEAVNGIKEGLAPNNELLEYQDKEQDYIEQVNALKSKLSASQNENEQLKQQLDHVKSLSMWQFRKWKQESTEL